MVSLVDCLSEWWLWKTGGRLGRERASCSAQPCLLPLMVFESPMARLTLQLLAPA